MLFSLSLGVCLILSIFARSRRLLARLRRVNDGVWCVEQALRACSTHHTPSSERRRREQAIAMGIRHALTINIAKPCTRSRAK